MADGELTVNYTVQALPCAVDVDKIDRSSNGGVVSDSQLAGAPMVEVAVKRKRGRPPRNPAAFGGGSAAAVAAVSKRVKKEKEEEDVCFICFDGGSLVMCDYRDCPKAYHPACVKRDESFFRKNIRWNCGWHLCNICQRNALFMCYTCPYSLCKGCVKQADILCIRGNKGFCRTCMSTIMLIEKLPQENKELVVVDFDDTTSWEYLFKVYWIYLKEKESLTIDELIRASNPWKLSGVQMKYNVQLQMHETSVSKVSELSNSVMPLEASSSRSRKTRKQAQQLNIDIQKIDKAEGNSVSSSLTVPDWASKELLEFVADMRNGDRSVLSQFDVQALLLDYIRKNNLRDPRRKCQIICDKRLVNLFNKERVGHFEMLKLLEYHFKQESRTNGLILGATIDPLSRPMENEGTPSDIQTTDRDVRRQTRRRGNDKGRQIDVDGYAAIDVHNISLIYLKRGLLETLLLDAENFRDKVVGSVVRIRISSNDQKQEMHRLVRIIGTTKASETYKVGGKTNNFTLKILNLNKIEDVTVDAISDQEFSEDECRRLRQSIKLGLVERMTVGEIREKAMALQAVRINDWLEAEIRKLNHLRDRAGEMGHQKELREYIEKIELLQAPEERQRRVREAPEVHADPKMDPSYGSDDDSGESDSKDQDGPWTPKYSKSYAKGVEFISPVRVGDNSKDDRAERLKPSAANGGRKRKHSAKFHGGGVEGAVVSHMVPQNSERVDSGSKVLEELNNRANLSVVSVNHGVATAGSISQAASDPSTATSRGVPVVSDISELEKIWRYQDPSGKVQGPFCLLQLRKWDSNGFFPSDLRVWRINDTYDQSILLADALKKQQSVEPHFQHQSCSASRDGAKSDDGKVNSVGEMGSESAASWMGPRSNEECSNSNSTDAIATPEAHELSLNGCINHPESDIPDGTGQSSAEKLKTQLIESLFNEEPSSVATADRSPVSAHVDLNSEPCHPSICTPKSDNMDSENCSPDAGRSGSGNSLHMISGETKAYVIPNSVPNSNDINLRDQNIENNLYDVSNMCKDLFDSCVSGSDASKVSDTDSKNAPTKTENKDMNAHDTDSKNAAALTACGQDSVTSSPIAGGTGVPNVAQKLENESMMTHGAENKHSISLNVRGGDSGTSWSTVSCGIDATLLPSIKRISKDTEAHAEGNERFVSSNVPAYDSGISWSTLSGAILDSNLRSISQKPDINSSNSPGMENKGTAAQVPGQDSGTSWSNISGAIGFSGIDAATLKLDGHISNVTLVENKHFPDPNVHGQNPCISWSTDSSLVGGEVHLPDVASEWGVYPSVHGKPSVEQLNSTLVSCSSAKISEVPRDHATLTSDSCQLTHCSSSHINCDSMDWQPIELSVLGDESVSDLLSEVEAMECLRGMSSPNSRMDCGNDSPGDDCFSPLGGLSPNIDPGKNDALSSTADIQFHIQHNYTNQPLNGAFHVNVSDIPRTSCILSTLGPDVVVEEVKPVMASMPHQNLISEASAPSQPPPLSSRTSCDLSTLGPEVVETVAKPTISHQNFISEASVFSLPPPPPPRTSCILSNLGPEVVESKLKPVMAPNSITEASLSSLPYLPPPIPPPPPLLPRSLAPSEEPPSSLPPTAIKAPSKPAPVAAKPSSPSLLPLPAARPPSPPSLSLAAKPPSPPSPPPPPAAKPPSPPPLLPPSLAPAEEPPSSQPPAAIKAPSKPAPVAAKPLSPSLLPLPAAKPPLPPPPPPAAKPPSLPPPAAKPPSPPSPPSAAKPPSPSPSRPPAAKPPSPPPPPPPSASKPPSPPPLLPAAKPSSSPQPPPGAPTTLTLDCPSSPREEGEVEATCISVPHQEVAPQSQRSQQLTQNKSMKVASVDTRKQGSEITSEWQPLGQQSGKFSGTASILGSPNMHWNAPGQGMATVSPNAHWSPTVMSQGSRMSQTSPRYNNGVGRHPGPKDRSHHHHGADSGFGKTRQTSWSRQPSFGGGGGSSRPPHRGRVCKYYESGFCKRGAACKFLHP